MELDSRPGVAPSREPLCFLFRFFSRVLNTLDLTSCSIGPAGGVAIGKALEGNGVALYMGENALGDEGERAIRRLQHRSWGGRLNSNACATLHTLHTVY